MVVGLAILPASLIAGLLWDSIGPAAPFAFGATMATLATVLFAWFLWKGPAGRDQTRSYQAV